AAQRIAQEFFANRDEAAENFELIARLLEEVLCCKLLGSGTAGYPRGVAELARDVPRCRPCLHGRRATSTQCRGCDGESAAAGRAILDERRGGFARRLGGGRNRSLRR